MKNKYLNKTNYCEFVVLENLIKNLFPLIQHSIENRKPLLNLSLR